MTTVGVTYLTDREALSRLLPECFDIAEGSQVIRVDKSRELAW